MKEATKAASNRIVGGGSTNGTATTTPVTSANASPITTRANTGGTLSEAGPLLEPPSIQPSCTSPAPNSLPEDHHRNQPISQVHSFCKIVFHSKIFFLIFFVNSMFEFFSNIFEIDDFFATVLLI